MDKPCIMHYDEGTTDERGVFRTIASSKMLGDDNPLIVRLCYSCTKWFKRDEDFLHHVSEHKELPSVGLGEWTVTAQSECSV
jgi:hypothetical protein